MRLVRAHAPPARARGAHHARAERLPVRPGAPARSTARPRRSMNVADAQLRLASERSGYPQTFVADCVARWMEQEPLELVARNAYAGVHEFAWRCAGTGRCASVCSPITPRTPSCARSAWKRRSTPSLTAQSPSVGVFKPHPRGLRARAGAARDRALRSRLRRRPGRGRRCRRGRAGGALLHPERQAPAERRGRLAVRSPATPS